MIAVLCMWAASIYAFMSNNFVHKISILMIYCTCSANVQMFDIFDTDHLINNLDIQSFNMLFIKNMLHTLHATYIRHDLYADFLLSEK